MAKKQRMYPVCALTVAGKTILRSFNMSANIVVSTRVNQLSPAWSFWLPSWATYSRIWGLSRKCCILCNAQLYIIIQLLCLAHTCTCKRAFYLLQTKIRKEITIKKCSSTLNFFSFDSSRWATDRRLYIQNLLWFCACECVRVRARMHARARRHICALFCTLNAWDVVLPICDIYTMQAAVSLQHL